MKPHPIAQRAFMDTETYVGSGNAWVDINLDRQKIIPPQGEENSDVVAKLARMLASQSDAASSYAGTGTTVKGGNKVAFIRFQCDDAESLGRFQATMAKAMIDLAQQRIAPGRAME